MTAGDAHGELVGRVLGGRYRVTSIIGRGGMGVVGRAMDEVLGREVAVKVLRAYTDAPAPELADLRARMRREAQAAARIRHSGVVTVHDVIEDRGLPVIVMELVDGPSLDDVLTERGALDPREVAAIGAGLMDALDAAHRAGVLHRDVKPGNVLLEHGGRVVLTDFGIATMEASGDDAMAKLTRSGELVGSLDYLPPERAQGAEPDRASDIWSLGMTLYAAVEGASPFRRTSVWSTLSAIVSEPLPEPLRAGPLAPVLAALLAKDPQSRPPADRAREMLKSVAAGGAAHPADHAPQAAPSPFPAPPPSPAPSPYPAPAPFPAPPPVSVSPAAPFPSPAQGPPQPAFAGHPPQDPRSTLRQPGAPAVGGPESHRGTAVNSRRRARTVIAATAAVVVAGGGIAYAVMDRHSSTGGPTAEAAAKASTPAGAGQHSTADAVNGTTMPGASSPGSSRKETTGTPSQHPSRTGAVGADGKEQPTATPGSSTGGGGAPSRPASSSPKPTSASKSCGGWSHRDPSPGTYGYMVGNYHVQTGPYQSCRSVTLAGSGAKIWYHCYVTNAYGNKWTYVRISGTNSSGWMSNDNLTRQSGPSIRC